MSIYSRGFGKSEFIYSFDIDQFINFADISDPYNEEIIIEISEHFFNGCDILSLWKVNNCTNTEKFGKIEKAEFILFLKSFIQKKYKEYINKYGDYYRTYPSMEEYDHYHYVHSNKFKYYSLYAFIISNLFKSFYKKIERYFKYTNKEIVQYTSAKNYLMAYYYFKF